MRKFIDLIETLEDGKMMFYLPDGVVISDEMRINQCFFNAKMICKANPNVTYIEGFLHSNHTGGSHVSHAWNSLRNQMFDYTAYLANNFVRQKYGIENENDLPFNHECKYESLGKMSHLQVVKYLSSGKSATDHPLIDKFKQKQLFGA